MNSMNDLLNRRQVLNRFGMGLGGLALNEMLAKEAVPPDHGVLGGTHAPPKAKRIIYLFMSGGPSHLDLYDYKPLLNKRHGEQLPDSVRGTQRLTGMSGNQSSIPMVGSPFKFTQHGQAGGWYSELLPHTASIADDLCVMRSMFTESINHGPGVTFFQTGSQIAGRPSMGAWLSYGLGADNSNLPNICRCQGAICANRCCAFLWTCPGWQPVAMPFRQQSCARFCRFPKRPTVEWGQIGMWCICPGSLDRLPFWRELGHSIGFTQTTTMNRASQF